MKKFKWNWGHGIVVAIALFMSFILYFVIKVQTDSKYDNDMVRADYYNHDMKYSQTLAKLRQTETLIEKPQVENTQAGFVVKFPQAYATKVSNGNVSLYRPSNEKLDFNQSLELTDASLLIPEKRLVDGLWDLSIEWDMDGETYLFQQRINRN